MRELMLEVAGFVKSGQVGPYEIWKKDCFTVMDAPEPPPPSNVGGKPISRLVMHNNTCGRHDHVLYMELEDVNGVFDSAKPA